MDRTDPLDAFHSWHTLEVQTAPAGPRSQSPPGVPVYLEYAVIRMPLQCIGATWLGAWVQPNTAAATPVVLSVHRALIAANVSGADAVGR